MNLKKEDLEWAQGVKAKFEEKMKVVCEKSKDKIPSTSVNGVHDDKSAKEAQTNSDDGINWWTNGFWGGIQWLLYHSTKDPMYMEIANKSEDMLDECFRQFYGIHHDVGFMWLPTSVANYRITGNEESRKRGLLAANILAGRFNPKGQYIRAWNDHLGDTDDNRGWAIIDCLLNINLLYWATEETKDPRFKEIAIMHADTAMNNFIRPDGSSKHIIEFNPETGEYVCSHGGQGYGVGSSWTRGQSWALYGFVLSYIHTGKQEYLDTALKVAHYFMANIPESGIIPVDFRQPKEPAFEDSSAAAIASCGLIELAKIVEGPDSDIYLNAALKMLKTLDATRCDYTLDNDCIVNNCSGAYHRNEHHYNLIYGDEFYMEAIYKLLGDDFLLW